MSNVPFQHHERECRYTEFIGNPKGYICIAAKEDHKVLLSERSNPPYMSNNLNSFRWENVAENFGNLIQMVPANARDTSHPTYHAQKEMLMQSSWAWLK